MAKSSRKSVFRNAALISGLITQEQMDQAIAAVHDQTAGPPVPLVEIDEKQLAQQLIEMELLTPYQAEQLKAGKTRLHLGPYVITDWLGQGGMGQVFKAVHEMMGRESAVKVLPLNKATPEAIASFRREMRMQARLDHPNLVRAYDAGHDGNVHYLVVEYVEGTDLRKLVREQKKLTMQQAANIIMQSARGLEYAHQRGLIHRDVKPGNILVTSDGMAKVSDLGLAGFISELDEDPRAGKIIGTADYLSPEQIKTPLEITSRSDIYSLGCTLYYAVTGKVPFPGGTSSNKALRHCEETPWHPRRFNSDISEDFVEIIADMMEKDPDSRVSTAAEVAARLEPWAVEAGPLPAKQMTRSPWMPPSLPSELEDNPMHETGSGIFEFTEIPDESASQLSQGTDPFASAGQDTRSGRIPYPPPILPMHKRGKMSQGSRVTIALAVAIPLSLLLGAIIGYAIGSMSP